ncbi:uncharacterized protein LOC141714793 [Apium graveolens]|uniref:uncharacterized protein LOC141714793 n=1 Tax=Apium graveolens TaxID=4045 RepID=UPI003D7AEADD
MKTYADKKRSEREFIEGEEVFLILQPYRQSSIALKKNNKLCAKYYGPYEILKRVGRVAYQLKLPPNSKIHNTFHVSHLKRKIGVKKVVQVNLPEMADTGEFDLKPQKILDRKLIKKGDLSVVMVLVQWEQGNENEVTWEVWDKLVKKFPKVVDLN